MPTYKFKETVELVANERGVSLYSSHKDLLWEIEHDLKNGTISAKEAIDRLKEHKDFRFNFSADDFETILKATK